ncbi:hypothetical protein EVA_14522 [gut metagenome]|uniref:Uncharacterized protein n=1 Tax=gut metagenome TaxID=749906 RepID=J9G6E8_9ZZZZ
MNTKVCTLQPTLYVVLRLLPIAQRKPSTYLFGLFPSLRQ